MTYQENQPGIAIVTGFFDIGRGRWQVHARSNDWYLSRFAHLARLANPMVVYTQPGLAGDILAVREAAGHGALTTVVPVEDFRAGQEDLLERIAAVQQHPAYREFVADPNLPVTWNWDYALLGYLRHAFVNHAVASGLVDAGLVAWVDIGYLRHAGDLGGAPAWSHDFDPDWLHLFAPAPYRDRMLGFDLVRRASVPLFSGVMVGSPDAWAAASPALDAPVRHLLGGGLVGDAAVVAYLAEQEDPDLFEVHEIDVLRHGRSAVLRLFNDLAEPAGVEPEPAAGEPAADVLVMIPTRGRPAEAAACFAALRERSVRSDVVLGVDEDDPLLDAYLAIPGANVDVLPPVRAVGTLNLLASRHGARYRYLSCMADDQRVRTPGWDDELVRAIAGEPWGVASGADGRGGWAAGGLVVRSAMARALGYFAQPALVDGGVADWLRALGEGLGSLRLGDAVVEDVGTAPPRGPAYPIASLGRDIARLERAASAMNVDVNVDVDVDVDVGIGSTMNPAAGTVSAAGRER